MDDTTDQGTGSELPVPVTCTGSVRLPWRVNGPQAPGEAAGRGD